MCGLYVYGFREFICLEPMTICLEDQSLFVEHVVLIQYSQFVFVVVLKKDNAKGTAWGHLNRVKKHIFLIRDQNVKLFFIA